MQIGGRAGAGWGTVTGSFSGQGLRDTRGQSHPMTGSVAVHGWDERRWRLEGVNLSTPARTSLERAAAGGA